MRLNEYTGLIDGSVLERLLEAGVPMLLRYALDDGNDAVFCVAIHCLHSLLVLKPEEVYTVCYINFIATISLCVYCRPCVLLFVYSQHLLDNYFHCYHGNLLPSLKSSKRPQVSPDDDEEDKETDLEILQRDVVEVMVTCSNLRTYAYIGI